jgi:hypothetical protein
MVLRSGKRVSARGRVLAASGWLLLGPALWPGEARAGFLQKPDTTQVITLATLGGFDSAFDHAGRLRRSATFAKAAVDTHVSHGWSERVTLLAQISSERLRPAVINAGDGYDATIGLFGARWRIGAVGAMTLSLQPMVGYGLSTTGRGVVADLRIVAAQSFTIAGAPAFIETQFGYRHGAPGQPREWRTDLTFGVRPAERWLLLQQFFLAHGVCGAAAAACARLKTQVSAVYEITPSWSVQLGLFATIAGQRAALEAGGVLGVWRQF